MIIFRFNLNSSTSLSSEIGIKSISVLQLLESERPWFRLSMTPGEGAAKFEHIFPPFGVGDPSTFIYMMQTITQTYLSGTACNCTHLSRETCVF